MNRVLRETGIELGESAIKLRNLRMITWLWTEGNTEYYKVSSNWSLQQVLSGWRSLNGLNALSLSDAALCA